eukprot:405662-Prorocentrum_minimum.AAC.1
MAASRALTRLLIFSSRLSIGGEDGGLASPWTEVYSECKNALVGGLARHVGVGDIVGDGVEKPIDVPLLRLGLE